jgi:hypothetical protein
MYRLTNALVSASVLAAVVALTIGVPMARADLLNPSFESPDKGAGNSVYGCPSDWTSDVGFNGYITNEMNTNVYGPIPDGHQFIELSGSGLWQNTGILLQSGTTYLLTVAASSSSSLGGGTIFIALGAASNTTVLGTTFGSQSWSIGHPYSDDTVSAEYTAPVGQPEPQYLTVHISVQAGWTAVDNVRLSSTSIPEPSSVLLLATGLIGLLCYAWRKRK